MCVHFQYNFDFKRLLCIVTIVSYQYPKILSIMTDQLKITKLDKMLCVETNIAISWA